MQDVKAASLQKEAIILAGGFGTRLKGVISTTPKPLANVGMHPFIYYLLKNLESQDFKKVILALGYQAEQCIERLSSYTFNFQLEYSIENKPLGTGGAIKKALSKTTQEYVFVLNGDTFFEIDYSSMLETHLRLSSLITIAGSFLPEPDRFGLLKIDRQRVTSFISTALTKMPGYVNLGTYLINRHILTEFEDNTYFSFEIDYLQTIVNLQKIVFFPISKPFLDIGIPEDYARAESFLNNVYSKKFAEHLIELNVTEDNNEDKANIFIFVYGSLKRGEDNSNYLKQAQFVGEYITSEPHYDMMYSDVPFVYKKNPGFYIFGEIYHISLRQLLLLDKLEQNGALYTRELISMHEFDNKVWCYLCTQAICLKQSGIEEKNIIPPVGSVLQWKRGITEVV